MSNKEKFSKLSINNEVEIQNLFNDVFRDILHNPKMGLIGRIADKTPINKKYEILKNYFENNGGTLRIGKENDLIYAPQSIQNKAIKSQFAGGGTQGKTQLGGV